MAYPAAQLIAAYTAANVGVAPDASTTAILGSMATQTQAGQMADATALACVVNSADMTTTVANTADQFFTGLTTSQAGLAFLVNSGANATDLNDPYYAAFNIENRYMNFAANLGLLGAGAASFASTYGSMTFAAFVAALYETIIG